MSVSFSKSKNEKRIKISALEILKYGSIIEKKYNYLLNTCNYDITRNMYLYVPSKPNVEIIGVDILAGYVILRIDAIFKNVVVNVRDENNIHVIVPENFLESYDKGKVILAAISDILLKYYNSCLEFKSFKTDITKVKSTNGDFELEISSTGIFLCVEKKKNYSKFCSVLYEHYISENNHIISVTDKEFELLKSLYFYLEDCPKWLKEEYLMHRKYKGINKKKILRILKNYVGGLR